MVGRAAPVMVPLPFDTSHVWEGFVGWAATLTWYAAPGASLVGNSKAPGRITRRSSLPLLRSNSPRPTSPRTEPPTGKVSRAEQPATTDAANKAKASAPACGARGSSEREDLCMACPEMT